MKNKTYCLCLLIFHLFFSHDGFTQGVQIPLDLDLFQQKLNAKHPFNIQDWEIEEFDKSYTVFTEDAIAYKIDSSLQILKEDLNEKLFNTQLSAYSSPQNVLIPLFINKNGHLGFFEFDFSHNLLKQTIKHELLKTSGDWIGKLSSGGKQAAYVKLKFYYQAEIGYNKNGRNVTMQIDSIKLVDHKKRLKDDYDEFNLFNPLLFKDELVNDLSFLNLKGKIVHQDSFGRHLYQITSKTIYPLAENDYPKNFQLQVQFNADGTKELIAIDGYNFEENYPEKAFRSVFIRQFESILSRLTPQKYQDKIVPSRYNFHFLVNSPQDRKIVSISSFLPSSSLNSRNGAKISPNFKIKPNTAASVTDSADFHAIHRSGYQISYKKGYNQLVRELNKLLENLEVNAMPTTKDSLNIRFVIDHGLFGYISSDIVSNRNHQIIRNTLKKLGNNWIPANHSGFGEKGYQAIGEIHCHYQIVKDQQQKSRLVISHIEPLWTRQYLVQQIDNK